MADTKIVLEWLTKADEDFLFAERDLLDEDTFFSLLCFHFQQSAEKYLKALNLCDGLKLEKTHNLIDLLEKVKTKHTDIESIRDDIVVLQPFYVDTRYPVSYPTGITRKDAGEAYESAKTIRDYVRSIILP